jgi:hypothetical protein
MPISISRSRRIGRFAVTCTIAAAAACASTNSNGTSGGSAGVAPAPRASIASAPKSDWIQIFNGKDLSEWDIKFAKHPLGENFNDTFRVEDGMLKVRYDKWTAFNGEFGHIFYKRPFNYYLVAAEYRFVGNQVTGAQQRDHDRRPVGAEHGAQSGLPHLTRGAAPRRAQ